MFIKPVANYAYARQNFKANNYQTNVNRSYKSDSLSFGRTTAIARLNDMPLTDTAYTLGTDILKANLGESLDEKLEVPIKQLYYALDRKVKAILKTKPLNDQDTEQYIHIITPQHEKPSIIYEVQEDVLDATYIHPETDDVFSFRFIKGELVNIVHCSADDLANLANVRGQLIEFIQERGHYKVANAIPTFLSKNIVASSYLYN